MTKEEANNINSWLAIKYGCLYDGRAKFRLVWSTDLLETRHGLFLERITATAVDRPIVFESLIEDTRPVPKYHYAMDRWVLEKLDFNAKPSEELVDQPLIPYECLWIFWQGDTGEYVEPVLPFIDMCCYMELHKTLKGHKPTEEQIAREYVEWRKSEAAKIREIIDNEIPDQANALLKGEAVLNAGTKSHI